MLNDPIAAELERQAAEDLRARAESSRDAAERARAAGEQARIVAEVGRETLMTAVHATAETLETALDHMKVVEDMRRTLREIRDVNKLDVN
jgi:cell fate (sporulation/competence/biofilm development) regulator YmcA (YheA/YmcA/DUF963 family)